MTGSILNKRSIELTCYDHQVEPHGRCWGWVGLRLASSSLEERWPGLGCIPEDEECGDRSTRTVWFKEDEQINRRALVSGLDVAPQTQASSYASRGRGCC